MKTLENLKQYKHAEFGEQVTRWVVALVTVAVVTAVAMVAISMVTAVGIAAFVTLVFDVNQFQWFGNYQYLYWGALAVLVAGAWFLANESYRHRALRKNEMEKLGYLFKIWNPRHPKSLEG